MPASLSEEDEQHEVLLPGVGSSTPSLDVPDRHVSPRDERGGDTGLGTRAIHACSALLITAMKRFVAAILAEPCTTLHRRPRRPLYCNCSTRQWPGSSGLDAGATCLRQPYDGPLEKATYPFACPCPRGSHALSVTCSGLGALLGPSSHVLDVGRYL